MLVTTTTIEDFHGFSLVHLQKNINPTRPRLHSTGRIWELAEIHHLIFCLFTCKFVSNSSGSAKDEFQPGSKFVRYRVNGVLFTAIYMHVSQDFLFQNANQN